MENEYEHLSNAASTKAELAIAEQKGFYEREIQQATQKTIDDRQRLVAELEDKRVRAMMI